VLQNILFVEQMCSAANRLFVAIGNQWSLPSILDNDHRVNCNGWHPHFKKISGWDNAQVHSLGLRGNEFCVWLIGPFAWLMAGRANAIHLCL
jgi:hypothetical protein